MVFGATRCHEDTQTSTPSSSAAPRYLAHSHAAIATSTGGSIFGTTPISP
jgi:hypothetical protein